MFEISCLEEIKTRRESVISLNEPQWIPRSFEVWKIMLPQNLRIVLQLIASIFESISLTVAHYPVRQSGSSRRIFYPSQSYRGKQPFLGPLPAL